MQNVCGSVPELGLCMGSVSSFSRLESFASLLLELLPSHGLHLLMVVSVRRPPVAAMVRHVADVLVVVRTRVLIVIRVLVAFLGGALASLLAVFLSLAATALVLILVVRVVKRIG